MARVREIRTQLSKYFGKGDEHKEMSGLKMPLNKTGHGLRRALIVGWEHLALWKA